MSTISARGNDIDEVFNVVSGNEAVRQRIYQRLRLFKGEDPDNPNLGVDYFGKIFGKRDRTAAVQEIERAVLSVEGVVSVVSINYRFINTAIRGRQRRIEIDVEYCTCYEPTPARLFVQA